MSCMSRDGSLRLHMMNTLVIRGYRRRRSRRRCTPSNRSKTRHSFARNSLGLGSKRLRPSPLKGIGSRTPRETSTEIVLAVSDRLTFERNEDYDTTMGEDIQHTLLECTRPELVVE